MPGLLRVPGPGGCRAGQRGEGGAVGFMWPLLLCLGECREAWILGSFLTPN